MSSGKTSRVIDGPYANWGTDDEIATVNLANGANLKLGQPLCVDVTSLGPDQNVPNNGALLPLCERLVATTNTNAGPIFGIMTGMSAVLPKGVVLAQLQGIPTWTNSSGAAIVVTITVRQLGWGYVLCGTAAIGSAGGNSVLVGSSLVTSTAQIFAIQGTGVVNGTVGTALGTAINTNEAALVAGLAVGSGAPAGPGVVSVAPLNMVGIVPNTIVLIDSLASGQQEAVSVGSISYPTFSIALANAHAGGFKITGPGVNAAKNSVLISTPGAGGTYQGLVATYINVGA